MIKGALWAVALIASPAILPDNPEWMEVAPAQTGCALTDSSRLGWVQKVLNSESYSFSRTILGLSHLEGQTVRPLGSEVGDAAVCDELYERLNADQQSELASADPIYSVTYYQVGDRYLVYWDPNPPYYLRVSALTSFDMQFNEIGTGIW